MPDPVAEAPEEVAVPEPDSVTEVLFKQLLESKTSRSIPYNNMHIYLVSLPLSTV